eukprot:5597156-Alexandrium_andersonii.AAC.1
MSASLVGSEMCIRDSPCASARQAGGGAAAVAREAVCGAARGGRVLPALQDPQPQEEPALPAVRYVIMAV